MSVGTRDMYRTHSRAFARVSEHVRYALGAHVLKRLAYEVSVDLVVYADRVHGEVVSTIRYDYRNTSVPFLQLPDTIYQIPACPCEEPLATEQRFRLARTEDIGHAASEIPTRHLVWRHDPTRQVLRPLPNACDDMRSGWIAAMGIHREIAENFFFLACSYMISSKCPLDPYDC